MGGGTLCGMITAVFANTGRSGIPGKAWPWESTEDEGTTSMEPWGRPCGTKDDGLMVEICWIGGVVEVACMTEGVVCNTGKD